MNGNFKDRTEAGQRLSRLLNVYRDKEAVVYALPRGGVEVAAEVARALNLQMDLIITRKIGHPENPEFAMGAIAENGHAVFNRQDNLDAEPKWYAKEAEKQKIEARRRRELYSGGRKPVSCNGKTAILVDDGIATGLTMKAALKEISLHFSPKEIIIAVPVIAKDIEEELEREGAEVVAIITDRDFLGSVGAYYQDFSQVSDEKVVRIMKSFKRPAKIRKADVVQFADAYQ